MRLVRYSSELRPSVPAPGRTLLQASRAWGEPLLRAFQTLADNLRAHFGENQCIQLYENHFGFLSAEAGNGNCTIYQLSAAAMILTWITAVRVRAVPRAASLQEAEEWLQNDDNASTFSSCLTEAQQNAVLSSIRNLDYGPEFLDILPYVAEVFETSDEILCAYGPRRRSKRASGIFYTPSDVADYVVRQTIKLTNEARPARESPGRWLDPACGTGCFLVSVLYNLADAHELDCGLTALEFAAEHLFGIDLSPMAIQSAAFVLFLCCNGTADPGIPAKHWITTLRRNLAVCDATTIYSTDALGRLLAPLAEGVDHVVTNPPYIRGKCADQLSLIPNKTAGNNKHSGEEVHLAYVGLMLRLTRRPAACGGLVIPLSLSFSSKKSHQEIRATMRKTGASWWIANFDRTPDSLFGDDVKTRNAIVFFRRDPACRPELHTTELLRWNSRNRGTLFANIKFQKHEQPLISTAPFPKIGDPFGGQLLQFFERPAVNRMHEDIERVCKPKGDLRLLRNGMTAYNWLPFELSIADTVADNRTFHYWRARHDTDLYAVFAILMSRFSYWLWRVWGDGFHLTDSFIRSMPISVASLEHRVQNELAALGRQLDTEMRHYPAVSSNAGVNNVSYCAYCCEQVLDSIDNIIAQAILLPPGSVDYAKNQIKQTVVAGRENEMGLNRALSRWESKERIEKCLSILET